MATAVLGLLSHIYVRGVKDACNCRDEMMCRDFIAKTNEAGVYGFLWKERDARFDLNTRNGKDFIYDIISFITSERIICKKHLITYLQRIYSPSTYHYCMLHITQEFYKRGMLDYLQHPNPTKLYTIIQNPLNSRWGSNGAKKGTRQDTKQMINEACIDRATRCEESLEKNPKNRYATRRYQFTNFEMSLWRALNNEPVKKENKRESNRVMEIGGWRTESRVAKSGTGTRGRPPKDRT